MNVTRAVSTGELTIRNVAPASAEAAALIAALNAEMIARYPEVGATRIVLETGARQPEALALYGSAGYVTIAPYGEYIASPLSVCMGKELGLVD